MGSLVNSQSGEILLTSTQKDWERVEKIAATTLIAYEKATSELPQDSESLYRLGAAYRYSAFVERDLNKRNALRSKAYETFFSAGIKMRPIEWSLAAFVAAGEMAQNDKEILTLAQAAARTANAFMDKSKNINKIYFSFLYNDDDKITFPYQILEIFNYFDDRDSFLRSYDPEAYTWLNTILINFTESCKGESEKLIVFTTLFDLYRRGKWLKVYDNVENLATFPFMLLYIHSGNENFLNLGSSYFESVGLPQPKDGWAQIAQNAEKFRQKLRDSLHEEQTKGNPNLCRDTEGLLIHVKDVHKITDDPKFCSKLAQIINKYPLSSKVISPLYGDSESVRRMNSYLENILVHEEWLDKRRTSRKN
jgi:hypothetical protein